LIAVIYGTRPEAIKLASVVEALEERKIKYFTLCTGQHLELLDGLMRPDFNLRLMEPKQTASEFIAKALPLIDAFIEARGIEQVIVQGDTASAFAGALAAFHRKIPIAHVEAGLRTYDLNAPFPEEGYRQMIDRIATQLYPPTEDASKNLLKERLTHHSPTGNTGIDAAFNVVQKNLGRSIIEDEPFVLATLHRREATGRPAEAVHRALKRISKDIPVILPVHPNGILPEARSKEILYVAPLNYPDLIQTVRKAAFIITDSGGIQEEAATFGIPLLITRTTTERNEIVRIGGAKLVGFDEDKIVEEALKLLNPVTRAAMSVPTNYYGDGKAGKRIVEDLLR
jgi:UDP-N-acetylglucosamine 2-epimerase (non-hydrolysing)